MKMQLNALLLVYQTKKKILKKQSDTIRYWLSIIQMQRQIMYTNEITRNILQMSLATLNSHSVCVQLMLSCCVRQINDSTV